MHVVIHTTDGGHIALGRVDDPMPLIEAFQHPDETVLGISLDESAMTYILKTNIVRIDVD